MANAIKSVKFVLTTGRLIICRIHCFKELGWESVTLHFITSVMATWWILIPFGLNANVKMNNCFAAGWSWAAWEYLPVKPMDEMDALKEKLDMLPIISCSRINRKNACFSNFPFPSGTLGGRRWSDLQSVVTPHVDGVRNVLTFNTVS